MQLLTPAVSRSTASSKTEGKAYLLVASPFCRKGLVPPQCSRWEELELPRQSVPPAFISAELFCQQRITWVFSSLVVNKYASPVTINFGHEGEETLQGTAAAPLDTAFPVTGFLLNPNWNQSKSLIKEVSTINKRGIKQKSGGLPNWGNHQLLSSSLPDPALCHGTRLKLHLQCLFGLLEAGVQEAATASALEAAARHAPKAFW